MTAQPICSEWHRVSSMLLLGWQDTELYSQLKAKQTVRLPCLVVKFIAPCSSDCPITCPITVSVYIRTRLWWNVTVTFQLSHGRTWVRSICYGHPWVRVHLLVKINHLRLGHPVVESDVPECVPLLCGSVVIADDSVGFCVLLSM